MATIEEQEQLLATLKFTPRTYRISMWGYGGEIAMGTVDKKIFDYFKHRRLSVADYAWDSDYAEEQKIPEEYQPFYSGSWYECDNIAHANGVERDSGTLQIEDENGDEVLQASLDSFDGGDDSPEWCCGDEAWIGQAGEGAVVFIGRSNEKGTFFEGEIELTQPFDITKLSLTYDEIDGAEIVTSVMYDGEDIDNFGGSTDGKSSDFGFYLVKDDDKWEAYKDVDSISYPTTDWFPKKVNPVYVGNYEVETAGKNSYTYHARWTGSKWVSAWADDEDTAEEIKIKQWRGVSFDPNAEEEWDPASELDKIINNTKSTIDLEVALEELKQEFETLLEEEAECNCVQCDWKGKVDETNDWDGQMACPQCGEPVEITDTDTDTQKPTGTWPF